MKYKIGVYGLGVMGASIAQNILNHGFPTAVYSISAKEVGQFPSEPYGEMCKVCNSQEELLECLERPRKVFIMITAGTPVDSVLASLLPQLEQGDVIYDGGNSYYKDTDRRCECCKEKGVHYVGVGVSGGQSGALNGPSIMPGGSVEGFRIGEKILTTIAAHEDGTPCCSYIGEGGSGHYVKMVHNGIEYAILQLIAEAYFIMTEGLGLSHIEALEIFKKWKDTKLSSYLIDISIQVMEKYEEDGTPLINKILDVAQQKGTGQWTLIESIERGIYAPGIYEAVLARSFSAKKAMRIKGKQILKADVKKMHLEDTAQELGQALLIAIILAYSQGMELIQSASESYGWNINMPALADVWRAGCIIRSRLLKDVKAALSEEAVPMVLTTSLEQLRQQEGLLRHVTVAAERAGLAVTGFAAALHYYDYYRTEDMPVRFVQALRDCFGAHTYLRNDKQGYFHTEW